VRPARCVALALEILFQFNSSNQVSVEDGPFHLFGLVCDCKISAYNSKPQHDEYSDAVSSQRASVTHAATVE
jgi:hypothetical protein